MHFSSDISSFAPKMRTIKRSNIVTPLSEYHFINNVPFNSISLLRPLMIEIINKILCTDNCIQRLKNIKLFIEGCQARSAQKA